MPKSCEILNYISSKGKYSPSLLLHCFQAIHFHQTKWGYVTTELLEESVNDGIKKVSGRIYSTVDITAHLALLVEVTIDVKVVKSRIRLVSRTETSNLSDDQHIFFGKIVVCLIEKVNLLPYGIGKLTPFSHYVDEFKADAAKSCNYYCTSASNSSASNSVNAQSENSVSAFRDRASSFSGTVTEKSSITASSYSTPASRVPSPSFVKNGGVSSALPRHVKFERVTPRRMDKFSLPPSAERNIDCKVSNVAFMAIVRRDGSDVIFPQVSHDKLLCTILAAITSDIKPCHKELIDMVICYKEFGSNRYMEKISKTKVRGVISLLKQAKIIDVDWQGNRVLTEEEQQEANDRLCGSQDTPSCETVFAPAKLLLSNCIHSYLDLRRQHDNYLIHFAHMNDRQREEEHHRHQRDSGPKNTWNSDKAIYRTDKTSFSEIIWSDSNVDERLDYIAIVQHASEFFANNYRTIAESMKLIVDMEDSDAVVVDDAVSTSGMQTLAFPRQSLVYPAKVESTKITGDMDNSNDASVNYAWSTTIPSIAFPQLSPIRKSHGSPMNDSDSMMHSTDSGDTDISDSTPYSMWHSLVPTLRNHNSAAKYDARAFPRQLSPPGYPCYPNVSRVNNAYGGDNSIYYDENIVQNKPPQYAYPLYAQNAPNPGQSTASIGFLPFQDNRKNYR